MKTLIIGGASGYTWDELKLWITSIKKTGFSGDVVVVATNITSETIDKLANEGVGISLYGTQQEDGSYKAHSNGAPHVERFFYIWNFLLEHASNYDYVIATDTRDVIFQSDPSVWLENNLQKQKLVASSEGMKYASEPWNSQNLLQTFGPYFHKLFKDNLIYNVGVLAGSAEYMRDLFFMIFQMSINRPIPIVDQVVYNVVLQQEPYKSITNFVDNSNAWAAQLAVTEDAIRSGSGDIGLSVQQDPSNLVIYQLAYQDKQPTLTDDGLVVNADGVPFCIVHQYDRTHSWANTIIARVEA